MNAEFPSTMKPNTPPTNPRLRPGLFTVVLLLISITALSSTASMAAEAGKDDEVVSLDPFSVTAKPDASGYGVTSATTISRLNTPLRDIPQTINIVSEQFIKELAAPTLGEAVAFMPNVTTRAGAPDRFQVRSIDVFSQFRNGFRYTTGASLDYVKDLSNIDRIEIIKGLGSATTGRGEAGGVINLITKKPKAAPATSIRGVMDQYGYYETTLDTTGPLNKSGSILYRAISSYQGGETFSPNVRYNSFSFFPSLQFRFSERTDLLIEGSLQSGETPGAEFFEIIDGRPRFARGSNGVIVSSLPPNGALVKFKMVPLTQAQTLPWLKPEAEVYEATTSLNHKFSDWFSTRQAVVLFKAGVDREYTRLSGQLSGENGWIFAPSDTARMAPIDMVEQLQFSTNETDTKFISYQGDFLFDFKNKVMTNQTLIGYEYTYRTIFTRSKRATDNRGYRVFDNSAFLNLQRSDMLPQSVSTWTHNDRTEASVYIQHTAKLFRDRLEITGGWRYDKLEEDIHDFLNKKYTESRPDPTDGTFRVGASYRLFPWMSTYAVHAEQKDPTNTVLRFPQGTFGVAGRDPGELVSGARTVKLDEVGLKSEVMDGKLTFNVTYYEITEGSNIRSNNFHTNSADLVSPLYNWSENLVDPSGISNGWEIEVMGAPTERFSFYSSASFPTNETLQAVQADGSVVKSFRRGHSKARLNFAGNFLISKQQGWAYYAQTAFGWIDDVVWNPDNKILGSSSLRWDLGVKVVHRLQKGAWEAQLRMQNVLDQYIVTGTGNSGTSPRRLSFSLERSF